MDRYPGEFMNSNKFLSKGGKKTFMFDERLPSLPIPNLHTTLEKYVASVTPHLTAGELARTKQVVSDFENTEGQILHSLLVDRAKKLRNWLEEWWLSYAYLKLRMPVSPLVNVCGIGPYHYDIWPPTSGTQVSRAALSLYFHMEHWQHLRREEIASDSGKSGSEPWSMQQFRRLYNCCRIPGQEEDTITVNFKTALEGESPSHIVVFCNKRIYRMDVLSSSGKLYTPPQFERALSRIKSDALSKGPGFGLSCLTSENRTTWYKLREHLIALSPGNLSNLELIQTALIGLSLVEDSPTTNTQLAQEALLGRPGNCWYDKSYNSIWFENGTSVSNCDHAPMDAMTSVSVSYFIDCRLKECKGRWQGEADLSTIPSLEELIFAWDDKLDYSVRSAEAGFLTLAKNIEIINPEFGVFGKDLLRKLGLHPDTFVQVCLQYGYYKLHGKPAPTYETATTRKFFNGRTETVRSCTNEAVLFCKEMMNELACPLMKLKLFKQAMDKHLSQMRECMDGQGIDRHLLGLKITALENGFPTPQLFLDPAFEKSGGNGNYILSTSFIGFTSVHGGVAPMCKDGYGFFYRMGAGRMIFFVSSWISDESTSAVKLYQAVADAMVEMVGLLQSHKLAAL